MHQLQLVLDSHNRIWETKLNHYINLTDQDAWFPNNRLLGLCVKY